MLTARTADSGTGSIIGKANIGGTGYFYVLTADHVIHATTPANSIGFGSPGGAGSFATSYPISFNATGGPTGNEDLAISVVRYGAPDATFNNVQPLHVWDPSTSIITAGTGTTGTEFTEIGYGDTGAPHLDGTGTFDGYTRTVANFDGVQRFQNNTVTALPVGAAPNAPYVESQVRWVLDNPGVPGEGVSWPGDSGGPYLLNEPSGVTTASNPSGYPDSGNQLITISTDTIFGVHAFSVLGDNPKLFGSENGGVLLTQADVTWINNFVNAQAVPEPSSWVLLIVGLAGLAWTGWRRRVR